MLRPSFITVFIACLGFSLLSAQEATEVDVVEARAEPTWDEKARILEVGAFREVLNAASLSDEQTVFFQGLNFFYQEQYLEVLSLFRDRLKNYSADEKDKAIEVYLKSLLYLDLDVVTVRLALEEVELVKPVLESTSPLIRTLLGVGYVRLGELEKSVLYCSSIEPLERNGLCWWVLLKCSIVLDDDASYDELVATVTERFGDSSNFAEELVLAELDRHFLKGEIDTFESTVAAVMAKPDGLSTLSRLVERIESWALVADEVVLQKFLDELNVLLLSSGVVSQEEVKITVEYLIASLDLRLNGRFSKYLDSGLAQDKLSVIKKKSALLLAMKAAETKDMSLFTAISQYLINNAPDLEAVLKLSLANLRFEEENYAAAQAILETIVPENDNYLENIIHYNLDVLVLLQGAESEFDAGLSNSQFQLEHLLASAYLNPAKPIEALLVIIEESVLLPASDWNSLVLAYVEVSLERGRNDYLKYRELLNMFQLTDASGSQTRQYWGLLSKINLLENEYPAALESLGELSKHLVLREDLYHLKISQANTYLLNESPQLAIEVLDELKASQSESASLETIYYLSGLAHLLIGESESLTKAQKYFENLILSESPYQYSAKLRLAQLWVSRGEFTMAADVFYELYLSNASSELRYQAAAGYVETSIQLADTTENAYEDISLVCDGVLSDPGISNLLRVHILKLKGDSALIWGTTEQAKEAYSLAVQLPSNSEAEKQEQASMAKDLIQMHLDASEYQTAHDLAKASAEAYRTEVESFERLARKIYLERLIWLEEIGE